MARDARMLHEKTALQRQIDATDLQIDALVYELYGLTEEEIRIIFMRRSRLTNESETPRLVAILQSVWAC